MRGRLRCSRIVLPELPVAMSTKHVRTGADVKVRRERPNRMRELWQCRNPRRTYLRAGLWLWSTYEGDGATQLLAVWVKGCSAGSATPCVTSAACYPYVTHRLIG